MITKIENNKKGFTLIELLVVISIIGLLSTIAITSLNGARAKARDAKRLSDIEQIKNALELYYLDNGYYPLSGGASLPNSGWNNSTDSSWTTFQSSLAPYLVVDVDPINTSGAWAYNGYVYNYFSRGYGCQQQWYMLVYKLESGGSDSPGVTSCDGHVFNYSGTITVGNCKGC